MPDETKSTPPPPPDGEPKPAAEKPAGTAQPPSSADKASATPPAAAPAKPAAPPKLAGPAPVPWDSPMVAKLRGHYGSGIREASAYLGQEYMVVESALIPEILQVLRDEEQFDYCVDVTAVHYPKREKSFDVLWILYSFPRNQRIRVKTMIGDGESIPSVAGLWPTADWLERECYDMFGVQFTGHPGLKRILLPDGWKGHPLRKDYGIIQQDQEWVQINLGIESGQ